MAVEWSGLTPELLLTLDRGQGPLRADPGGRRFYTVAHLPDGRSEAAVISAALDRSVGLYGMSRHRVFRRHRTARARVRLR